MRVVRVPAEAPGAPIVAPDLSAGDVARQAQLARRALELSRPLLPGERLDVDRASAQELERLPRVGPQLARRIVDERDAHGSFGSLEGLKRVSGVGPGTLRGFERTTTFSGAVLPGAVPSVPTAGTAAGSRPPVAPCPAQPLNPNTASAAELACLPGIGPGIAERIVTWRTAHGGFREVKDLEQVPGIGRARLARLSPLLRLP